MRKVVAKKTNGKRKRKRRGGRRRLRERQKKNTKKRGRVGREKENKEDRKKGVWTSGQCRPKRQTILVYSCLCRQSVFEINHLSMAIIICSFASLKLAGSVQAIGQRAEEGLKEHLPRKKDKEQTEEGK